MSMIISNPNINAVLNLEIIPILQQLSADLVDRVEIEEQSLEFVSFRCHLKTVMLPLFVHLTIKRTGNLFEVSNVEDDFPAVQLFVENTYCTLLFLDKDTIELTGNLALRNVPASVERGVRKLVLQVGERLKTFIERL